MSAQCCYSLNYWITIATTAIIIAFIVVAITIAAIIILAKPVTTATTIVATKLITVTVIIIVIFTTVIVAVVSEDSFIAITTAIAVTITVAFTAVVIATNWDYVWMISSKESPSWLIETLLEWWFKRVLVAWEMHQNMVNDSVKIIDLIERKIIKISAQQNAMIFAMWVNLS